MIRYMSGMANPLEWHKFYFKKWSEDESVILMDLEQIGAYWLLLVRQMHEGDIPEDPRLQASLLGKGEHDHYVTEIWPKLSSKFVAVNGKPGRLHNALLTEVMNDDKKRRAAQSEGGKKGQGVKSNVLPDDDEVPTGGVSERITALKDAGGNYVTIPKKLSSAEEHGVMAYDVSEWKAVGVWIANGCHWITKKEGKSFFPLSTILRANLAGTVQDAVAMMAEVEAYEASKPAPAPKVETADEWIAWSRSVGQTIRQTPWEKNPDMADRWLPERRWKYLLEEEYIGENVYEQHVGAA